MNQDKPIMSRDAKIIEGIQILGKYNDSLDADHDVIFCGPRYPQDVTPDDTSRLEELGWYVDEENKSWICFV